MVPPSAYMDSALTWIASAIRELGGLEVGFLYIVTDDISASINMDDPVVIFWLSCCQLLMFHNTGKHIETYRQKLHTAYKDLYGWNAEKETFPVHLFG
jgi:hypothetical protein